MITRQLLPLAFLFAASGALAPPPGKPTPQTSDPEARLKELGVTLTPPSPPVANYVNAVRTGNLLFLAGTGPAGPDGRDVIGKLGRDLTVEQG
jgi:enamine deaminase RidA (YjgF/YER057c/UK114 family)